jgi:hypothetical protein
MAVDCSSRYALPKKRRANSGYAGVFTKPHLISGYEIPVKLCGIVLEQSMA